MKKGLLVMALLAFSSTAQANEQMQSLTQEARLLSQQFLSQLQPALMAAMKAGGPVNALSVCQAKAPAISADLSKNSGWDVRRISLKPRGTAATPDDWEAGVLKRFDKDLASGKKTNKIEYAEIVKVEGKEEFRYMKAIGTVTMCLACHGTQISEPVKAALIKNYPNDKATGYSEGQLRGAFSFSKLRLD